MLKDAEVADLIEAQIAAHESTLVRRNGACLDVDVGVLRADGRVVTYALTLSALREGVSARERAPLLLPAFCPDRHINKDGSFCLTWQRGARLRVRNADEAQMWWGTLLQFLRKQEIAAQRKRWPGKAWAHGVAAQHQHNAEECAAALGPAFERALSEGRLHVRPKAAASGTFLMLFDGERWLFAVWEKFKRVATLKQPCVCGNRSVQLRACGDHARRAADLVFELLAWRRTEKAFWRDYGGAKCCGTMDDCPLRKNGVGAAAANDSAAIAGAA